MRRQLPLVLLLFTLSGVSGLVYELVWIRLLSHLLGGTSYAISIVLAAFMGGLALGSREFGARADASARPLRLYVKLELGIAALAALVHVLIVYATPVYVAAAGVLPGSTLGALRVIIAFALLLPPTFLMGGTLPVLSRVIVERRERLGSGLGLLYAVNTFGAVLGVFLTGFVFIAALGLAGCTALAVAINLFIALGIHLIDRRLPAIGPARNELEAESAGESAAAEPAFAEMNPALLGLVFALSGFASLGYELYWSRSLQHFLGNSTYAFSTMLTTFLLGLALGGWIGGRLADRVASPARLLGWVQLAVGATAMATVPLLWGWLPGLAAREIFVSAELSWNTYLLYHFLAAAAIMVLPTLLTGMTFPIVNRIGIASLARLGHGVGRLYFLNTLGAILGSLAAGFLVMPWLGAKGALIATAMLSAALGLVAHLGARRRGRLEPLLATAGLVAVAIAAPLALGSGGSILSDSQEPEDRVIFERQDHAGETRVYRKTRTGDLHMSVEGHHIGGNEPGILRKEKILAHLPMALVPDAKRTLSIGLGSGITLGSLALYDGIEILSCVEIVPGVVEGAKRFSMLNNAVLEDPRLDLHVGDGVQYLLTTRERFDLISSDSKLNPEYSGNAPLLSRDYYELCRDRLTERGVMVQWLASHVPANEVKVIARSFVEAFPHVAIFWYDHYNMILAGSSSPIVIDMDALAAVAADPAFATELTPLHLDNPYVLPSLYVADRGLLKAQLGAGPVNTWARPRLEFTLIREYRIKGRPYHEDDNLRWLLRLQRDAGPPALRGDFDPEVLARFRFSAAKLLEGFGLGGGISRLDNAISVFQEGLAANPDDRRLAELLQAISIGDEQLEEAHAAGRLETAPELVRLGLVRMDRNDVEGALAAFEEARRVAPSDDDVLYNRLLALRSLRRVSEFEQSLAEFRKLHPRDARGLSLEGRALANRMQFEAALVSFREAVELDPDNHVYQNNLATTLARLERYGEAAERYAAVAAVDPDYQKSAYFAAACFSMAGDTESAARWMRVSLERNLATATDFREQGFFENLRHSPHWDPQGLE